MTLTDDRVAVPAPAGTEGNAVQSRRPGRKRYPIGQHPDAPPGHLHPNPVTCWTYGCRAPSCVQAERTRQAERRAYEHRVTGVVPVEAVRAHLHRLIAVGVTENGIALAANATLKTVKALLRDGDHTYPSYSTRKALVAVEPTDCAWIGATVTTRRIQALMWMGWTSERIADHAGIVQSTISKLSRGARFVRPGTAKAVACTYERLSDSDGPSIAAARHARKNDWKPPSWWDDIELGTRFELDEEAVADDVRITVERRGTVNDALEALGVDGEQAVRIREQWVEDLTRDGYSAGEVARTVGIAERSVARVLARLRRLGLDISSGRNGVWDRAA